MEKVTGRLVDSFQADNLIAKLFPPPDPFIIELATPGTYKRGIVLSLESNGKYAVLGSGSGKARAVLADDTTADDDTAAAYRSGHFNRNALTVADNYTMTAADEDELRISGIFLSDSVPNDHPYHNGSLAAAEEAEENGGGETPGGGDSGSGGGT